MIDYISREDVLEILRGKGAPWDAYSKVQSLPAADVWPVRRGKWTSVFDIGTVCNQCGYDIEEHGFDVRTDGEPNYCPNCGADMREES